MRRFNAFNVSIYFALRVYKYKFMCISYPSHFLHRMQECRVKDNRHTYYIIYNIYDTSVVH